MQFLVRQPVFDRSMAVFGYELLFRNDQQDFACLADLDMAARFTIDASALVGLDVLCDGKRAFINCTRETLVTRTVHLLAPDSVVLEILEGIEPDEEVLAACRELRRAGYTLALDDVVCAADLEPFRDTVEIAKVDFRLTSSDQQQEIATKFADTGIIMVAEKVESAEEHKRALGLGYRFMQGFFFQKPSKVASREIPALKVNYLRLLSCLQKPDLDLAEIERIIKAEPSLCYRILRYLNSPIFGFASRVESIRHALVLLGEKETRRWLSVAALVGVGDDRPSGLVSWALVRAKFCELVGERVLGKNSGAFLLGLVSSLPFLIDFPLEYVLEKLPIDPMIREAVLGQENPYRRVYDIVLAYERGDWESCSRLAGEVSFLERELARCYVDSVRWTADIGNADQTKPSFSGRGGLQLPVS